MKTIREFLENPVLNSDKFYGFYDWFCSTKALEKRMLALVPKVKFLVKEGILDQDNTYIWLKNNCPFTGSLYDDIRISTIKDDEFLGGFCPRSGHKTELKCSVWTLKGEYKPYDFKHENFNELKDKLINLFKKED